MEISPAIHDAVRTLLEADGHFELGPTIKDLARLPRVVQARKKCVALGSHICVDNNPAACS
jgi:hypothetical protein